MKLKLKLKKRDAKPREIAYETGSARSRVIFLPVLALLLSLFVELGNRGFSPARLFGFITHSPVAFLFGWLVILTTLVFSELFKRRRAVLCTTALLWTALGIVEFMVIKERTQPFSSVDILMMKDGLSLMTIYYSWAKIILIFSSAFAAICAIIMMFARMKRRQHYNFPMSLAIFVGFTLLSVMVAVLGMRGEALPRRFDSLVDAYNDYGFVTCFTFTFGQQGISRPNEYGPETVAEVLTGIESDSGDEFVYPLFDEDDNLAQPNVVFVQLESFFDVNTVIGSEYSADPTPWFNRLCNRFPSGILYVPTVGGGTANTEFEVLTGLNRDAFGAGETPYNTIMQQSTCETVCYDLKDYGYTATAMHNNTATFFGRNNVYPNLGFDRFVPLEYMQNVKYSPIGWCRDAVLTDEILTALKTTDSRDVVFCVAVETHGKYEETYEPKEGDIEVLSLPEQIPLAPFQNFVNALPHSDDFLRQLTLALLKFDEPTILVAYGDHLPALELTNELLSTGSIYATRYVIWNNFGGQFNAPDLQAYRLSAHLTKQLGFSGGVVARLHQATDIDDVSEEYLQKLELLGYDMLYGDRQAFEGEYPYLRTDMRMGSRDIVVTDVQREYHRLLVTGENFTEFSAIVVDGQALDTIFIDSQHIAARSDDPAAVAALCVAQLARDGSELGRTEEFAITEE